MTESQSRLLCAGAVGLLCQCSTKLSVGPESNDIRDSIEDMIADWCKETGWTYQRILHRIEVFPPEANLLEQGLALQAASIKQSEVL